MKLFIRRVSKSSEKLQTFEGLSCLSQDEMMDWSGGYGKTSSKSGLVRNPTQPSHGISSNGSSSYGSTSGHSHTIHGHSGPCPNNSGSSYGSTSGHRHVWTKWGYGPHQICKPCGKKNFWLGPMGPNDPYYEVKISSKIN